MFSTNRCVLFTRALRVAVVGSLTTCALSARAADPNEFLVYNYDFQNDGTVQLPGRLFVPLNYDPQQEYPIVIFYHGQGERGTNNTSQVNGNIDNLLAAAKTNGFFLYAPQLSTSYGSWASGPVSDAMRMLSNATRDYSIDLDRIYVTGLSLGGGGCWTSIIKYQNAIAAGVPICGIDPLGGYNVTDLVGLPIWAFHAANDSTVNVSTTRTNVNDIRVAGGLAALTFPPTYTGGIYDSPDENNLKYREYSTGNHNIWGTVYGTSSLYTWLLAKTNPVELATLQLGETMLFDFGNTATATDSLGQTWNSSAFGFHNTLGATFQFAMVTNGETTSVSLDVAQAFAGHTTNGSTALYQTGIGTDGWATPASATSVLLFRGLIPGAVYQLDVYGASTTANRQTRYTANGIFADLNATNNTTNTAVLNGVVADANGRIQLSVAAVPGSGSTIGQINAMKLTMTALSESIFAQDYNDSSVLANYISATPDSGQFNDISAETDGGTWSITSSRLQIARTGTSGNGAGFSRYTGPVSEAPDVLEFNVKVSLTGVNTFSNIATLSLGNITSALDYNSSYPSGAIGHTLVIKGRGNGAFGFQLATVTGNYPANGTAVNVCWRVNQSAVSQTYVGEDSASHTISSGSCDLWVNGTLIFANVARSYGSATPKLGGYRMQVTTSQATTLTFDDIVVYDSLPQ